MRRDARLLDHLAPDLCFIRDEGLGLGRAAAGGVQVDLGKMLSLLKTPKAKKFWSFPDYKF
jgi:hypothetical protein